MSRKDIPQRDVTKLTSLGFSDDEWNIIAELLRVAQLSLADEIKALSARWPGTTFIETLSKWRERAGRLRGRIERRAD